MRSSALAIAAAAALVLAMLGIGIARGGLPGGGERFTGTTYDPPKAAADFELIDHHGTRVALDDYRGTALLLFFGYTNCPDVCPLTLQKLSRVLGSIRAAVDTSDVRLLLVTVDPQRDTPEVLAAYVQRFGPFATGLTGDPDALEEMRREYGVFAEPSAPAHGGHQGMEMNHTPQVFGIDPSGDLRVLLPMDADDRSIAREIRMLIRS